MLVKSENFWRSATAESDFFAYFSLQTFTHMYVFDWEPNCSLSLRSYVLFFKAYKLSTKLNKAFGAYKT